MPNNSVLTESILNTTKHMLGIENNYTHFDTDIITDINSAINVLAQIGAVNDGYYIEGATETYGDMLGENLPVAMIVKTYIYHKVRLMFDPPLNSSVSQLIEKQIAEEEFRLKVQLDKSDEEGNNGTDGS